MLNKIISMQIILTLLFMSSALHSANKRTHAKVDINNLIDEVLNRNYNPETVKWFIRDKVFAINYVNFYELYRNRADSTAKWSSIKNRLTRSKSGCIALSNLAPEGYDKLYTRIDWLVDKKDIENATEIDNRLKDLENPFNNDANAVDDGGNNANIVTDNINPVIIGMTSISSELTASNTASNLVPNNQYYLPAGSHSFNNPQIIYSLGLTPYVQGYCERLQSSMPPSEVNMSNPPTFDLPRQQDVTLSAINMPNFSYPRYYKPILEEELNYLCRNDCCTVTEVIAAIKNLTRDIIDIDDSNLIYILSMVNAGAGFITKNNLRNWLWFFGPLNQLSAHLSYFINEGKSYFQAFSQDYSLINLPNHYFVVYAPYYNDNDQQDIVVVYLLIKTLDNLHVVNILKDYAYNLYYYYQRNNNKKIIEKKEYTSLKEAINSLVKTGNNFKYTPFYNEDITDNLTGVRDTQVPKAKVKQFIVPSNK